MKRLTTPKLSFQIPLERSLVKSARISFKQTDELVLVKENDDLKWEDNAIILKLSQEETKKFNAGIMEIELHVLTTEGDSFIIEEPIRVLVKDVLNDEVLE